MMFHDRRRFMRATGNLAFAVGGLGALSAGGLGGLLFSRAARAEIGETLVIALPGAPPGWDPLGTGARDPWAQSIWNAVLGAYLERGPDLALRPGLIEKWEWADAAGTEARLVLRAGARWHDGRPVAPRDLIWNLRRAAKAEKSRGRGYWANIREFGDEGRAIVLRLHRHAPDLFARLAFRGAFPLPPHYHKKKGAKGFAKAPLGAGPYRVERQAGGAGGEMRLRAFRGHWAGAPPFEHVVLRFMPDPDDRAAALMTGDVQVAAALPATALAQFDAEAEIVVSGAPVAEMAVVQLNDLHPMTDPQVRRAADLAIHRRALVERLLAGQGVPLAGLEMPGSAAYDPALEAAYDPARAAALLARAGFSPDRPARLVLQTTRGHRPMDFETAQAIAGMWQRVGIAAEIEVTGPDRIDELAAWDRLAPACLRVWDNATGDPGSTTGALLWGGSPDSVWDSVALDEKLTPLIWERMATDRRLDGWRALGREIAAQSLALPLYQYKQGIAYHRGLALVPHGAGWILPQRIGRKAT